MYGMLRILPKGCESLWGVLENMCGMLRILLKGLNPFGEDPSQVNIQKQFLYFNTKSSIVEAIMKWKCFFSLTFDPHKGKLFPNLI